jgi:hypothetical protein
LTAFGKWFGERFANLVERRWFRVDGTPSDEVRGILDPFGGVDLSLFDGFSRFLEASG